MDAGQNDRALMLLQSVGGTLKMARALAAVRRPVDLAGLAENVGLLCAACLDLPPELGRALRPGLIGVLGELDALAAGLREGAGSP